MTSSRNERGDRPVSRSAVQNSPGSNVRTSGSYVTVPPDASAYEPVVSQNPARIVVPTLRYECNQGWSQLSPSDSSRTESDERQPSLPRTPQPVIEPERWRRRAPLMSILRRSGSSSSLLPVQIGISKRRSLPNNRVMFTDPILMESNSTAEGSPKLSKHSRHRHREYRK